jgi:hypothetical protein
MAWAWLTVKNTKKLAISSQSKRLQEEINNTVLILKHLGYTEKEAISKMAKALKNKINGYENSEGVSYGETICSFQFCFMSLMHKKVSSN